MERASYLKEKLGPFLFQFPPNWQKNLERLEEFAELAKKTVKKHYFVLEFRHPSWFSEEVFDFLKKNKNISLCLADSPDWPFKEIITGNFVYVRLHGNRELYASSYSEKELKTGQKN